MSNKKQGLTVKEFSRFSDMPISTLHYYDKIGVLHPESHGVDCESLYRYYSPPQITAVKMVRVLKEIGVSLNDIIAFAESRNPESAAKLLSENRNKVENEIRFLQGVHSYICSFLDLIHEGMDAKENIISVMDIEETPLALGGVNDFGDSPDFYEAYTHYCYSSHKSAANLYYPIGGYFESMEAFLTTPSRPTRFFSLDPKGSDLQSAGTYLVGYTRGYYGQTNDLPERMAAFANANGIIYTGAVYNKYLLDEISIADPSRYLLKVSASVRETRRVSSRRPRRHL